VRLLREGRIIGWFQGRSELGPRALGQRSILSDPRRADGKEVLNSRVKHRESFRPFAPAVLAEHVAEWFETGGSESSAGDFMLRVCAFHAARRREVPAVVHVDGTGRLQSVSPAANPVFHRLLERFFRATGVPMLLNTSFNVMGEPIVETPDDALWSLLDTGLDACVIGDRVVRRRPGFTSLLDLYPWCPASRYVLEFAANGGALSGELDHLQTASFEVEAPARGKVTPRIGPLLYGLLRHIDGRTSGRELLRKLTPAMDEPTLVWRLGMLRRALVVRFSVEPVAPDRDGAATAGEAARAPVLKGES
jgi:carbamoyltransferase